MKKILTQYGVCALAVALMVPLAQAQPVGIQAAFAKDAGTLSDKFTGLARVMSGKYDWKPAQGVRSVADVYLKNMSDFVAMNGIYAKHFSQPFPARTTIGAAALPLGACVEIDLVVKA